ncbi:methyltransferase domain-containing protein, partial [Klebsiella pneumoniae]
ARARQAAADKGVIDNMHFVQCAAQDIAQHLESPVDLVLFHAVLEWVAEPQEILHTLWSTLRAGGGLSLMFYNANGLLMHNMVAGNFDYVQLGMPKKKKRTLSPDYPREPQQVYHWLEEIGWQIVSKTGVRVFHDYLREKRQQHDSYAALLALETRYCRQEPYLSLGRYIHVTALKSQAHSRRCKDKV